MFWTVLTVGGFPPELRVVLGIQNILAIPPHSPHQRKWVQGARERKLVSPVLWQCLQAFLYLEDRSFQWEDIAYENWRLGELLTGNNGASISYGQ